MEEILKKIILFFVLFLNFLLFSQESKEKKKISVGLVKNEFFEKKINGKNLNEIIEETLSKNRKYEFTFYKAELQENYKKYQRGELDVIFPIERRYWREDQDLLFSKDVYSENFYIASDSYNIKNISQVKGKAIYVEKNLAHVEFLKRILKNNDIHTTIVEVENLKNYRDEIIGISEISSQDMTYKHKIGLLPAATIGVRKRLYDFLLDLNEILDNGGREFITNHKKSIEKEIKKENFLSSLSEKEREYLKNIKEIKVAYEENSTISHYIPEKKSYNGLLPLLMEKINYYLDIPISIQNSPLDSWEKVLMMFEMDKTDILAMSRTAEREEKYSFSKKISDLTIYKIDNLKIQKIKDEKIGVVENTIEEAIGRRYYPRESIIKFKDTQNLRNALKDGLLTSALTFDKNLIVNKNYLSENFYLIPLSVAFSKENSEMRDIFNKMLFHLIDEESFVEELRTIEKEYLENKAEEAKRYTFWLEVSGVFGFLIISIFFYRIKNAKKLAELAFIDSLSKLGNRYSFDKFCENMEKEDGVAIVIDLDNFKKANDKYGHDLGDQIISYCADIFKRVMSKKRVFRISGDEYFIFIKKEEHEKYLEKLVKEIEKSEFLKKYSISCSIGYYLKDKNISMNQAFKYADLAMYRAKKESSTTIFKATEEFIKTSIKEEFIRSHIEKAIETEFYPVYQPKISLKDSQKIIGAEALARWESKEIGMVYPMEFITVAENIKIIGKVDFKIAEEGIKQLAKWKESKLVDEDFILSFNISMHTFENENVPKVIEELLKKYNVSGKNIELEITESVISKNVASTLEKLKKLKEMGANLSLDDFTAGHSTAGILPLLPIDIVKFDRSLILSMNQEKEKGSMVYTSLINLIKDMGMDITAEGVEEEEDHKFLLENGVEYAQGYLFGRPEKCQDFQSKFLKKSKDKEKEIL